MVNPPKHSVKVLDFHVVLQAGGPLEALGAVGTLLMGEGRGVALVLRVSVEMLGALVEF